MLHYYVTTNTNIHSYNFIYIGIREHLKVCSKCSKKWAYVASKCENNTTEFFCQECKSTNDDKDNDKEKDDKNKPIPANTIKRFSRDKVEDIDIIPQLSDTDTPKVLELIQQTFKIDREKYEYFKSFDVAKEHLVTKLYYARTAENILEFHYPESIKTRTNVRYPDEFFTLSYKDVMSLMDETPLSQGVIDFVVDCFNFYIQHSEPSDTPPSILFGKCYDVENIVPSISNYILLDSYFTSSINKSKKETSNMMKDLKHWYQQHDKEYITDCLTYF